MSIPLGSLLMTIAIKHNLSVRSFPRLNSRISFQRICRQRKTCLSAIDLSDGGKLSPVAEATLRYGAGAVQNFGSLLRKASGGQAEFLAKPSLRPCVGAKCVQTTLRIDHQS